MNRSLLFFAALAFAAGTARWWFGGRDAFEQSAGSAVHLLIDVLPQLLAGLLLAGFISALLPRERMTRLLGDKSGLRGIAIATAIGAVLPGGPFASFAVVFGLFQAGADIGVTVALLISWATISINRLLIWEIPLMGVDFGVLRLLSSIPIPFIAGLLARWLARSHPIFRPKPAP